MAGDGTRPIDIGERIIALGDILRLLEVQEIVRIAAHDYPDSAQIGDVYAHFNLPLLHDRSNYRVILPKILKPGYFIPPDSEQLPLLSFNDVWRAEVTDFIPHMDYHQLTADHLINCIGGATNPDQLKAVMAERYERSLPHLSREEIWAQGFSFTRLQLLNRVTLDI